ncbi:heme-dependent oxidative N-demethylase subunit alpha family protein [Synoicihabitans lomoniglobus]|uniref:DUF3445 domain-containing protein n=1 Tax=Synoicihabitans lomoniglobus TaxID=2909285 RepID=A0AAF0I3D0_9BACT|nr:DUF3445 domain-containing protein [Opitutaceae bacterium LMO-M01]WED66059.1 DUF3445 domain-containing protein [Opitutaceae bacterium LMO-M01]
MSDWADLFPEDDFGFRLTLRRGDPTTFFAASSLGAAIGAERRRGLAQSPDDYVIMPPPAQTAWAEFVESATAWSGLPVSPDPVMAGQQLEPDVVLLCRDDRGVFRVAGGVVVFPSHWALADKMGLTLLETHGAVPGLNAKIGPAIDRYLDKIKPGFVAGRPNWGLAATDAWNLHPSTHPPALTAGMTTDQMWLRVERQILTPLPRTGAMLFAIRIERIRLDAFLADSDARRRFHRTISTMPPEVAAYKGLAAVADDLVERTR